MNLTNTEDSSTIPVMRKRLPLTEQFRRAIEAAPVPRSRICRDAGMSEATMSRFMNGKGGLSMEMFDRIADYLDLRLVGKASKPWREG